MKQNKFQKAVSGIPSPSLTIWIEKPIELHAYPISKQSVLPDWLVYALRNHKAKRLEGGDGSLKGFFVTVGTPEDHHKEWAGKGEVILHEANDDECEYLKVITEESFREKYISKRALTVQGIAERIAMNESRAK